MLYRARQMSCVREAAAMRRRGDIVPRRKALRCETQPAPENVAARRDAKLFHEEMPEAVGRQTRGASKRRKTNRTRLELAIEQPHGVDQSVVARSRLVFRQPAFPKGEARG